MSALAPRLFDLRYDALVQLGHSRLPALAPEWTDHNAHDPGIALMELLAWVAEAQLYSVGRTRRDERTAYAALLGVAAHGTRPACGLIWPDVADPSSPAATFVGSRIIDTDAAICPERLEDPVFRPERKILWAPGRILSLRARLADGTSRDLTASNKSGTAFLPFGEAAGPRDTLVLEFETRGDDGLFPSNRSEAEGAVWVVGVRSADDDAARDQGEVRESNPGNLAVWLVAGNDRFELPVHEDSTAGLLRTGGLVLDLPPVARVPKRFHVEIHAPRGFAQPPRLLRIEPNVLPVTQRGRVERELHEATGKPDFYLDLRGGGLCFEPGVPPLQVEVLAAGELREWSQCDRLSDHGPEDSVYEFDGARGRVSFGNGLNGSKPPHGQIYVSYFVSSGVDGNIARDGRWTVAGFDGVFGLNPEPVAGGMDRSDWTELRREARRNAKDQHALVSAADIELAARALPLLDVARAWIVPPTLAAPRTGTLSLIAMRARPGRTEPVRPPETARWLAAVRRSLAVRIPLGTRLVVAAPRYVDFSVRAHVEVMPGYDPDEIQKAVEQRLADRLALVESRSAGEPRPQGVPVSHTEVAAWIRAVEGVRRVTSLELVEKDGVRDLIKVPSSGLPRLVSTTITAARSDAGARQ